jgi:hypothetical protein
VDGLIRPHPKSFQQIFGTEVFLPCRRRRGFQKVMDKLRPRKNKNAKQIENDGGARWPVFLSR